MQEMLEIWVQFLGREGHLSPGGGPHNPLQYSCLENPMDRGAWLATVHRVAKSRTRLKQLSLGSNLLKCCFWFFLCFGFLAMSHVGFSFLTKNQAFTPCIGR